MVELKLKELNTLINEVKIENEFKREFAENQKLERANKLLDGVIKYCYNEGEMLFLFENAINKMRKKRLLVDSDIPYTQELLTFILEKKNIYHYIIEEDLIINISNKTYSDNELKTFYNNNKIKECNKKIKSAFFKVIVLILVTIFSYVPLGSDFVAGNLPQSHFIISYVDAGTNLINFIKKLYFYPLLLCSFFQFLTLTKIVIERIRLYKKLHFFIKN